MAFEITWEDVLNTAIGLRDELEELTTAQQDLILEDATEWVPESKFLNDTKKARRYFAAGLAVFAVGPAAGEGTQSSVSIDSFSSGVTLAVNNPTAKERVLSTVYGERYFHYEQKHFQAFFAG